jgi:hypothetical protein
MLILFSLISVELNYMRLDQRFRVQRYNSNQLEAVLSGAKVVYQKCLCELQSVAGSSTNGGWVIWEVPCTAGRLDPGHRAGAICEMGDRIFKS